MLRKEIALVAGLAIAFGSAGFAAAADEAPKRGERKPGAAAGRDPAARQEAIKKFDKDGDGKLSESERAEAMKARGGAPGAGGPPGGRLDPAKMQELVKKFDKDGDGKLSDTEKEAARADFQKTRGGAPGAGGRPGAGERGEMMKKFDKDGDGKLSDAERAEAAKSRGGAPDGKPRVRPENK